MLNRVLCLSLVSPSAIYSMQRKLLSSVSFTNVGQNTQGKHFTKKFNTLSTHLLGLQQKFGIFVQNCSIRMARFSIWCGVRLQVSMVTCTYGHW